MGVPFHNGEPMENTSTFDHTDIMQGTSDFIATCVIS